MGDIKTEFLFEITATLDRETLVDVGNMPHGNRQIVYVTGGSFEGPKLKGKVLPGGGDWFVTRPDGALVLDVRIALRTDDGAVIYMIYRGIRVVSKEVEERMARGETVDPSEFYFRTTLVFETASEKYGWLNRIVAVGTGFAAPGGVGYKVYAVL